MEKGACQCDASALRAACLGAASNQGGKSLRLDQVELVF